MTTWMTRQEAAEYLRVSTRQLDRLRLPRSTLGHRPRYSSVVLDQHLQVRTTTPAQQEKGRPEGRPYLFPVRRGPTDVSALIAKLRAGRR